MLKKLGISFLAIAIFFSKQLLAQNNIATKANYALAEHFSPGKIDKMLFTTSVYPNWLKTGDKFWYTYKTTEGEFYYIVDASKRSKKYLFNNHRMATMLSLITKDPYDYQHLPPINPTFNKGDTVFQFDVTNTQKKVYHLEYNIKTEALYEDKDWKEKNKKLAWLNIAPDSSYAVYSKNYNLYCMNKENYLKAIREEKDTTIVEQSLTTDGVADYSYGENYEIQMNDNEQKIKEEREKRRFAYVLWSPDSKRFALLRKDNRKVNFLWVVNSLATPRPLLKSFRYLMPGENDPTETALLVFTIENKRIDVIDVKKFTNQDIYIPREMSEKNNFNEFNPVTWLSKKSNELYFERRSRDRCKYDFCLVDLETAKVKVLIEEQTNTPSIGIQTPRLINDGKEIIHLSERDGWGHFYLYDNKGSIKNQITSTPARCINSSTIIDEKKRVLYYVETGGEKGEDPYYKHFYKINFDGTGLVLLNKGNYDHQVIVNDAKRYFIDNYSAVNSTPKSVLRDMDGKLILELETADLSSLLAAGYKFPEPFKAKAADGVTDIYGVMYKPFDFDSSKSYPIIEYVYPGPQTESVNKSFSNEMDKTDRLAQLGFIVITLGNRGGSPLRSRWYYNYSYGDLRDYGLADKKYVVEQLADKYKFIDAKRVGIIGHSGGGFMAAAALLQYPDFYKVAIAESGNHDNRIYNNEWAESHHGLKEVVNEKDSSAQFLFEIETNPQIAANLKGKLLLITGDQDDNVSPANTYRMADALIKANKRFDIFIMPGQDHGFVGPYAEYNFWLCADYFCKNLLGDDSHTMSADILEIRGEHKLSPSKMRSE